MPQVQPKDPKDIGTIVRSRTTGLYFRDGGWTDDVRNAQLFPNEEEARRACTSHHLTDLELILWEPGIQAEIARSSSPLREG